MTHIDSPICDKEITIYHIPDVKIGSTCNLKARMKNQGYTVDDCEVVEVIPAGVMRLRLVWEIEQYYATRFGYEPENEGHWATFFRQHTNNPMTGCTHTDEAKALISQAAKGRKVTQKVIDSTIERSSGTNHHSHRLANIFCAKTHVLLSSSVVIGEYATANGYDRSHLGATALGKRKQHKGIYAKYIK